MNVIQVQLGLYSALEVHFIELNLEVKISYTSSQPPGSVPGLSSMHVFYSVLKHECSSCIHTV